MLPIQTTSLKPQTTAHLAQTMTLLGLSTEELQQRIESELAVNPALELLDERRCPTCQKPLKGSGPCFECSFASGVSAEEPVVFVSTRDDFQFHSDGNSEADFPEDSSPSSLEDLPSYILRQIAPELEPAERPIAAFILNSLDEDGLLQISLIDIARFHHVRISMVAAVLSKIQRADPIGVGSPNSQEALLVQLEVLGENRATPRMASEVIQVGMKHLSRRQYAELGKLLSISTKEARETAQFIIENLYPFPARAHWGDIRQIQETTTTVYQRPDVIISRLNVEQNSPLIVEILLPIAGTLRINPLFRKEINKAPREKAERWKSDLENANLLVKCLKQRNHTMVRLMRILVTMQRNFILQGNKYLQPITRAKLARQLEVHESTISRAVANKCTQLPNGRIIPLSQFFDRSLHIRATLKHIISEENKPFSDTQLASLLAKEGFSVARRTVAKYRAMEGILPAHLRQKELPLSNL